MMAIVLACEVCGGPTVGAVGEACEGCATERTKPSKCPCPYCNGGKLVYLGRMGDRVLAFDFVLQARDAGIEGPLEAVEYYPDGLASKVVGS